MSQATEKVRARLEALQRGPGPGKFLLLRPVAIGLGGQVHGRIEVLRFALALGRTAVFPRLDDPPYGQSFAPLNDAVPTAEQLAGAEPVDPLREQTADVVIFDAERFSTIDDATEQAIGRRLEQVLGAPLPDLLTLGGAICDWMALTPEADAFVRAAQERLGVGAEVLGVHMRRGDKSVESIYVPARIVNERIADLHRRWPFAAVFLASDSQDAAREVQLPPGVRLIFDMQETRYNNANHKMLMTSPELAQQETLVALKNLKLLAACGGVVGQDNAHFAVVAAGVVAARTGLPDRVVLIDGRIVERTSRWRRFIFRSAWWARRGARRVLPWFTASARMKRLARQQAGQ